MNIEELQEEITLELDWLQTTVNEVLSLGKEIGNAEPTIREKTAAAAFLSQFYNGLENILKRICRFHEVSLPHGDTWHIDLFQYFCNPPRQPLPEFFDRSLAHELIPFRKFRHVFHHGYSFQLDWKPIKEGIGGIDCLFKKLRKKIIDYLEYLESENAKS